MRKIFKIQNRIVSNNHPPLIIAEIGINHNGNLEKAIQIADSAIKSGVEIIKHQTHIPDEEMSIESKNVIPGNSNKSIYEIIKKSTLSEKDEFKLMQYIKQKKKIFISTPFCKAAVDRLIKFRVPAFKIGSGECNNLELVKYICKFKKPIILSTGMNSIKTILPTVRLIEKYKSPLAIMHCTNVYPTPINKSRLNSIIQLKEKFKNHIIGYSDHTIGIECAISAVSLGALIIEKHYVDSRLRKGPDISCSMDKKELKKILEISNKIKNAVKGKKEPIKEEKITMKFAFASVVARRNIEKGETISEKNICLKRPGNGYFKFNQFRKLLGKKAKKYICENTQLKRKDIF